MPAHHRDEAALIAGLRRGDETAFGELIERHHASMLRVARLHVRSRAIAEEVVQETWMAVIEGIGRFEGRSTVRTWLFRILANRARERGRSERRTVPFSALATGASGDGSDGEAERLLDRRPLRGSETWAARPRAWPQDRLLSQEALDLVRAAIEELPEAQRTVIALRDIVGCNAEEACEALDITDGNQRVLLHRARARVRDALKRYLAEPAEAGYPSAGGAQVIDFPGDRPGHPRTSSA